jgi:hypothetical protein
MRHLRDGRRLDARFNHNGLVVQLVGACECFICRQVVAINNRHPDWPLVIVSSQMVAIVTLTTRQ